MRLFVTGASGHIGSAVVPDLLAAGHTVVGLARSDASAAALTAAGVEVRRGSLDDLDGLRAAAAEAEGVIHLAFKHELTYAGEFVRAAASDLLAIEAIGGALEGTDKRFVITSGTALLAMAVPGQLGVETAVLERGPRVDSENTVVAMAARGVRSSVVRLPPTVHSSLDHHGFVPTLISMARKNGVSVYVGDGANRWPAVHTLDAARLYRLAVESAPAGARLTVSPSRACRSARLLKRSAAVWDFRPRASHRTKPPRPRISRHVRAGRQSLVQRRDTRVAEMGAGAQRAARRSRGATLFRVVSDVSVAMEGFQGMSKKSVPAPGGTCSFGDREVARVGYGAMQLAGKGVFGPPKDRAGAIAVLRTAVESGVDHIDTSDYYGPHITNQIIREALHPYRDDLVIVTKIGARRGEDGRGFPPCRARH